MPNWIPIQGFYLVKPSEPYNKEKCDKEMALLEIKLSEAEKRMEEAKC